MAGQNTYEVKFRIGPGKGSHTTSTVRAGDSAEAERIVKKKYSQPIEIIDVRKR